MVGEVAGKKLYEATAKGDATTFEELVQENPDVLDGVWFACWNRSPLHVATMQGNAEIVESMLRRNPQLAEELDSQKSSPLHITAAKGYIGIAFKLVSVAPHVCWLRDCHGMNPIHIAAMNGQVKILEEMIRLDPSPAREKLGHGQNVMHLCVKHGWLGALQFLADNDDLSELVNEGDDDGDTVLHLAVRYNHVQIIKYLVGINKIDKKLRNAKGKTPLQIWSESHDPATESESSATHSQIREILKYDSATLDEFLQENQHLFSNRSPLHVATMQGREAIVEIMLSKNPQLAEELDSQKSSPLHIAAAKGYVRIASILLTAAEHMCWSRDCHGMNPIHIAAMNGNVGILEELIGRNPIPAREKMGLGDTVIHLCVKHNQLEALEFLANKLGDLINEGDDDGDTVLHLAVRYKQLEIIRYLVGSTKIEVRKENSEGQTAQEIVEESPPISSDIQTILKQATPFFPNKLGLDRRASDHIMVVVALIATVAFQAIIGPAGGVWQEASSTHKAGEAVMASTRPKIYKYFIYINTAAFVASIMVMFMLIPRNPFMNPLSNMIVPIGCGLAVTGAGLSYGASLMVIHPNPESLTVYSFLTLYDIIGGSFVGTIVLLHFLWKMILRRRTLGLH